VPDGSESGRGKASHERGDGVKGARSKTLTEGRRSRRHSRKCEEKKHFTLISRKRSSGETKTGLSSRKRLSREQLLLDKTKGAFKHTGGKKVTVERDDCIKKSSQSQNSTLLGEGSGKLEEL